MLNTNPIYHNIITQIIQHPYNISYCLFTSTFFTYIIYKQLSKLTYTRINLSELSYHPFLKRITIFNIMKQLCYLYVSITIQSKYCFIFIQKYPFSTYELTTLISYPLFVDYNNRTTYWTFFRSILFKFTYHPFSSWLNKLFVTRTY